SRIQKFDASGAFLAAWGSYGQGEGQLVGPYGVAINGGGNVYVTDDGNRVQKFDASGTFLTGWGRERAVGELANPTGVATEGSGNVDVADRETNRIQKFDPGGTFFTAWGSTGSGDGQFIFPSGVATDASGNVYVAAWSDCCPVAGARIQKFDASGTFLTAWLIQGSRNGEFAYSEGVATDRRGNVYLADAEHRRILKFDGNGTLLTARGSE